MGADELQATKRKQGDSFYRAALFYLKQFTFLYRKTFAAATGTCGVRVMEVETLAV